MSTGRGWAPTSPAAKTTGVASPTSLRERTIVEMLERYQEALAQAKGEGGIGGQFSSAMLLWDGQTWTPEFRELERCLWKLRELARQGGVIEDEPAHRVWWNIKERYLVAQLRRRTVHTQKTKRGYRVPVGIPPNAEIVSRVTQLRGEQSSVILRIWDNRVNSAILAIGVGWLADEFRGSPSLPEGMAAI